jgi:gliding motility-associated-like protein
MNSTSEILNCAMCFYSKLLVRNKKRVQSVLILLFFFTFLIQKTFAQAFACPQVTVSPNVNICSGSCTPLTATVQGTVATTSYSVSSVAYSPFPYNAGTNVLLGIDDTWSSALTIPFCFQFYGTTYTQLLIGSNGIITFDLTNAGGYCPWPLSSGNSIPTSNLPTNSIMGIYEDIDPTNMGGINYQVVGTSPCRAFVVSFYQVPHYGDPNSVSTSACGSPLFATYQMVLYETTNIIDINVQDKESCSGWNSGLAIEGIQDASGSSAVAVSGRNNTVWTTTNDAYRFTPTGAPQYALTWYDPSNTAIGTTPTISVCPTVATTYTAKVVNTTCSGPITVSAQVTVGINPPPCISTTCSFIAHGDTVCVGGTIVLSADTVTNATYKWTGPNGFVSTLRNLTIPNATLAQTGWYHVKDTIPSCTYSDSTFVQVNPNATANAGPDQTICGGSVTLAGTVSGGATMGIWSGGTGVFNPNDSTLNSTYTPSAAEITAGSVTLTLTNGAQTGSCPVATDQILITITATATANAGSSQHVCAGSTLTLAGSIGGNATGATWSGGTGTYSPDNTTLNAIYTPSAAEYAGDSLTLTLTTNTTGSTCAASSSNVTLYFFQSPVVNFTADSISGCITHCVNFTNTSSIDPNSTIVSYSWNFGDGGITSSLQNPQHCFSTAGFYTITLSERSNHGCSGTLTKSNFIQAFPNPIAEFVPSPNPATVIDPTITMNNESSYFVTYWNWNFGDGVTLAPNTSSPSHTYPSDSANNYLVTLIVHTVDGCADTVSHQIIIGPSFTFYMPNAFSPNGNGTNDYFFGSGTGISKYDLWIFDRWGNMIFHGHHIDDKWDGKSNSSKEVALIDVYVWKVTLIDVFNKTHDYIGTVTLTK